MSFLTTTILPLRIGNIDGNQYYICILGDIKLITNDDSLVIQTDYKFRNLISGELIIAEYILNLPANIKLTQYNESDDTYVMTKDLSHSLLIGKQYSEDVGSVGMLVIDDYDERIIELTDIIYNFKQKLYSNNKDINQLQGLIVSCKFSSTVPSIFNIDISSTITVGELTTVETVTLSNSTSSSSDDDSGSSASSFIAEDEDEMLNISSTPIGSSCFRKDLKITFINITGVNGSIDDWEQDGLTEQDVIDIAGSSGGSISLSPNAYLLNVPFRNSLDILQGDGTITLERTSEAWYDDRYGLSRKVDANEPRFVNGGLLIEPISRNYFVGSKDANQFETVNASIFENVRYDSAHQLTADLVTIDTPGQAWYLYKTINELTLTQGTYVTFSIRMSSANNTRVSIELLDTAGTNVFNFNETVELDKFLRRYKDFTVYIANATAGKLMVKINGLDTTVDDHFVISNMQIENIKVSTSEIETTTESGVVERKSDDVTINYFGNFPGSLSDKTVSFDIEVLGRFNESACCFYSGDFQVFIDDDTNTGKVSVAASLSETTDWIAADKFRFGATFNSETNTLTMYHDGINVASRVITLVDPPTDTVESYNQFLTEIYPTINNEEYMTSALQIPLDVIGSKIKLNYGNAYFVISNLRIIDQCLTEQQMKSF